MPIPADFQNRLYPLLPRIIGEFGTPFHIYDENGIRETIGEMQRLLCDTGYKQFFAVKAAPTPALLDIMAETGCGFDCSSIPEIILARHAGARSEDIMFTSNNTSTEEFEYALSGEGCVLNFDDIELVNKVSDIPKLVCFRYNPGDKRTGNSIIGEPAKAKYGVTSDQIVDAYALVKERGAERFGLHAMVCSNELSHTYVEDTLVMLLDIARDLARWHPHIRVEFINVGGGIGIPYHPDQEPFNFEVFATAARFHLAAFSKEHGWMPRLFTECGRYITGPHGVLIGRVINVARKYQTYYGTDTGMTGLMRPGMYGAYHHVDVLNPDGQKRTEHQGLASVVGSICENCDRLTAEPRILPDAYENDIIVVHDTGAHGRAMGFNYNGRLRPQELLLRANGCVELIRRAETNEDYFATLKFEQHTLGL